MDWQRDEQNRNVQWRRSEKGERKAGTDELEREVEEEEVAVSSKKIETENIKKMETEIVTETRVETRKRRTLSTNLPRAPALRSRRQDRR